ncbi:hypothetical protein K1719_044120 [Acacia pycnantha]|nr:hypothetical protein K1719_044120 [Acacia pycnantha]
MSKFDPYSHLSIILNSDGNLTPDPKGEEWIREYGDPSRCYLYGCGCGGNIVFNLGMKVSELKLEPLRIQGIIMNQPMFGGVKRTKLELQFATNELLPLPVLDFTS